MGLAEKIMENSSELDKLQLYWLGGAGFIIKINGIKIGIDLYLSDFCRKDNGDFKRLIPAPLKPEEIKLDYLIATHTHEDHFDIVSLNKFLCCETTTKLIGPTSVIEESKRLGYSRNRLIKLNRNDRITLDNFELRAVYCDHGNSAPDAIGIILIANDKHIYFTGDTNYRTDLSELIYISKKINILVVPINGKYGNPDSKEASYITSWAKPDIVIPCHYWLFKEHGGDPGQFVECCRKIAPESEIQVLAIGEEYSLK